FYLLSDMSPKALTTWDFSQFYGTVSPGADAKLRSFYRAPANWPTVVAIVTDQWTHPLPAWTRELLTHYSERGQISRAGLSLLLYRQCADGGCNLPSATPLHTGPRS